MEFRRNEVKRGRSHRREEVDSPEWRSLPVATEGTRWNSFPIPLRLLTSAATGFGRLRVAAEVMRRIRVNEESASLPRRLRDSGGCV
jgi:hypothetical protein